MTSFSSQYRRFSMTLVGLFFGLLTLSAGAVPGNESGTKGTGSAGRSVVSSLS